MYLLSIDRTLNRLHITLTQTFDEAQAEALCNDLERRLDELREGFHILTDLTNLESMELSSTPHIQKSMDLCNQHHVGKVIRIIPNPIQNFGLNVMSFFHYSKSVQVITCSNLEEALGPFSQE